MKRWLIILLTLALLLSYGLFLGNWFEPREGKPLPPAVETTAQAPTEAPTEAPTTVPPTTVPPTTAVPEPEADIHDLTAHHGFVYDLTAQRMLYTHGDQAEALAPASLSKLFTILVALEHLDPEEVVTVGKEVTWIYEHSSIAAVYSGNRLTVEQLVQGMLLQSGNDAAYALAVAAGRAIAQDPELSAQKALDAFMEQANLRCAQLGFSGTHLVTPDGMSAQEHYTTPRDLLRVSCLLLEDPMIRRHAATAQTHVVYESGQDYIWKNTNLLLHPDSEFYCPQAMGLKTGTTKAAGNCLIALFACEDRELLVCVLGCPDIPSRFRDALTLLEYYG